MICEKLSLIDFYGKEIHFSYKGEKRVTTKLGGISVLITILICAAFIWVVGKEVVLKQNPNIVDQTIKSFDLPYANIGAGKDYNFYFGVLDSSMSFTLDESYVSLRVQQVSLRYNISNGLPYMDFENLKLKRCNSDDFPNGTYSDSRNLDLFLCLDKNETAQIGSSIEMSSNPNSTYKILFLFVSRCTNSSSSKICKPKEEIDERLKTAIVIYSNSEYMIDLKNYEFPLFSTFETYYFKTDPKSRKEIKYYIMTNKIIDDIGLLSNELKETQHFSTKNYLLEYSEIPPEQIIFQITVYLDYEIKLIYRNYTKVFTIIAEVGGLLNFVSVGFHLLLFHYSSVILNNDIINQIYEFKEKKIQKQQSIPILTKGQLNQSTNLLFEMSAFSQLKDGKSIEPCENKLKIDNYVGGKTQAIVDKKEYENAVYDDHPQLRFIESWLAVFRIILCCQTRLDKCIPSFYNQLENDIKEKLEIFSFIRMEDEIKKLKLLLLSEPQLTVFNNLKPNFLRPDQDFLKIYQRNQSKFNPEEFTNSIEILKSSFDKLDRKLLKFSGEDEKEKSQ